LRPNPHDGVPDQDGTLFEIDNVRPVALGWIPETMGNIPDAFDHAIAVTVLMPIDMHTRIQ